MTIGALLLVAGAVVQACSQNPPPGADDDRPQIGPNGELMPQQRRQVRTGLSVLLDDSIRVIAGKRVGLITNQTGIDEKGRSGIDLLYSDERATKADVRLVALFSPEHGIRGTEDREHLSDSRDEKTKLPIISLYGNTTIAPPDSALKKIEVLIVDLQDVGTRTWTYTGAMLFAMRAAGRNNIPIVVLDRPNPITGTHTEGALLDTNLANPEESTPQKFSNGFSLWPMPLRHGLTMGELALYFKTTLKINVDLHVIPMRNWRRAMWYDQTGLPFVKPSPSLNNTAAMLIYPALVPFERTNVSVGRGTSEAFTRFGAPWMRADTVAKLLDDLGLTGVRFRSERFTPQNPGDSKYNGQNIPGVRIEITDRDLVQPSRVGAAIFWALNKLNRDSLQVNAAGFDERLGAASVREALLSGTDPDAVMDRQLGKVVEFEKEARKYHLYR
ncbi:MAG: exo-beta-N-acetylmuramidase NamZ family protein [Gemmatimonas sp.]